MNLAAHIAAHGGGISNELFMELALYDERDGYYSHNVTDIGPRGDFSTAATMSELPARRLVQHWQDTCRAYGRRLPIIEIGGGNASLALAIGRELGFLRRMRTRYYMVEKSPALRALQSLAGGNFVRVFPSIEQALRHAGGRAFIFCNELPDAFPARRFIRCSDSWQELGWELTQSGTIVESARPCSHLPASSAFSRPMPEGQIIEVHETYHNWYVAWQPLWKCGVFVTIDYGEEIGTLYHRRPRGTLRGYRAHTRLCAAELPALAGRCDITVDVNFSDLILLAERNAGDTVQMITQRDYLLPCANIKDPAEAHLLHCPGAGDHFRVLIQHRFEV